MKSSTSIISELKARGIEVLNAEFSASCPTIRLREDLDSFVRMAAVRNMKHMFYQVERLSGGEVETCLLEEETVEELPPDLELRLSAEIRRRKQKLFELKRRVGSERRIELFFPFSGVVYVYEEEDESLYPESLDSSIRAFLEENKGAIADFKEEKRAAEKEKRDRTLASLEEKIVSHDDFKLCTNAANRKRLAEMIYHEEDMQNFLTDNNVTFYALHEYVSFLWPKHKDSLKKS